MSDSTPEPQPNPETVARMEAAGYRRAGDTFHLSASDAARIADAMVEEAVAAARAEEEQAEREAGRERFGYVVNPRVGDKVLRDRLWKAWDDLAALRSVAKEEED